ncbi:MAG: DNA helicase [Fimbriimonas sp.]
MTLSVPIYRLKRKARLLSREAKIPLHEALDRIAAEEGFRSWSLLAAKAAAAAPAAKLFARLAPGDLVLLGARPGQGKTLLSLELAAEAMKAGHRAAFFTLEYTERDVRDLVGALDFDWARFDFDGSDAMGAESIVQRLASSPPGTLAVIDYLQVLDQRRENPALMDQVRTLKTFARERGLIVLLISQIARTYDSAKKPFPDTTDVRLPNPLDLGLFDKTCFLNDGEVRCS